MPASPSQHNSTLAISPLVANRTYDTLRSTPNQPLFPSPLAANASAESPSSGNFNRSSLGNGGARSANTSDNSINNLSQAEKLRLWRHDALMQHHYKTAEYIGDKVLSLTNDPNDAFWLAQVLYSNGNYYRARQLLSKNNLDSSSVSCRYLSALCLMKLEKFDEALDIVGETNPFKSEAQHVKNLDGGIKLEASLCFIRGQIYARLNNLERAKDCFKEAILVDVKCFEAFDEMIRNNMLTPLEEWELLSLLDFQDADENGDLIKALYTTRINKYVNGDKFEDAELKLNEEYNLGENNDVLLSKADLLFMQCKFQKSLEICEKILNKDEFNFATLPTYLSCLHEIGGKNKLFYTAHRLAAHYPKHSISWLAIGIYYLSINRITEARKFFLKSSLLDPNFGQAWIGFAHTFAAEGEHEQAISAYSTASRFFPGTHLPNLFLGMQYLQMSNLILAEEYLLSSYSICTMDPLLLNELGVIYYHKNHLESAENYFTQALSVAKKIDSDSKAWQSIHANLGHVYRRLNLFPRALYCFEKVLRINNNDSNIYSAIGLIHLKLGDFNKSIENLHHALSINNNDPVAKDLMRRALEENGLSSEENHISSNGSIFFKRSNELLQLNSNTLNYQKNNVTPLFNRQKNIINNNSNTLNQSIEQRATDLINGDDSSDDDDAIMEIESE
ncbi:Anaphase-promoting complex subunit cut9 [Wickerhamomyces ciferrii]|uniref:Anaphase-promoting complex subunit cut9 n=1 Tax=Wickerhamomyces ciferrii (strain ATCC 14091 / BCRC 22168 / CBS 111 / JCM 3599 / NBRC 0793 / NRRL Y-1031 F-60-10) TaxID=1206466 RepID=K0KTP3_WICCF|nr:Anaphase-promoting complex subunit cut9 [Wickerhamomyces ciferrii]CCH44754.1 Anaphase-promoting complex subunit cut9 [Wickerhamomyces ciferrii]